MTNAPPTPETTTMTFDSTITDATLASRAAIITRIRSALKARTGRTWSVTGGRGTAHGWLKITSPPARRTAGDFGYMTDDDRVVLGSALGKGPVHRQGESIPASYAYYREYIDRAEGREPRAAGVHYWD